MYIVSFSESQPVSFEQLVPLLTAAKPGDISRVGQVPVLTKKTDQEFLNRSLVILGFEALVFRTDQNGEVEIISDGKDLALKK